MNNTTIRLNGGVSFQVRNNGGEKPILVIVGEATEVYCHPADTTACMATLAHYMAATAPKEVRDA